MLVAEPLGRPGMGSLPLRRSVRLRSVRFPIACIMGEPRGPPTHAAHPASPWARRHSALCRFPDVEGGTFRSESAPNRRVTSLFQFTV